MGILKKLFDTEYKELKRFEGLANEIEALDEEMQKIGNNLLKTIAVYFELCLIGLFYRLTLSWILS